MITRFTFKCALALLLTSTLANTHSSAQLVTTFAGNLAAGYTDDAGTAAQFNQPITISLDKSKNIYVADAENHRIRKISLAGMVTTFAGSTAGNVNDTGIRAQLNHPLGVVVDDSGYVYVADSKNNSIRKISPAGVVSTLAGTGTAGSANGAGNVATFNYPNGLAIDASKNIYVADASNNMIRKVTPAGVVSTIAGAIASGSNDGQDTLARFNYPTGVAVDASNNLFVADENNHLIRKITAAGIVSTYAGSYLDNIDDTGTAAAFNSPYGIAVDATGNLYVAEIGNNQIRKITTSKMVMSLAGNGAVGSDDGLKSLASFNNPTGVAMDGLGTLYVSDWKNNMIRKIDLTVTGIFTVHTTNKLSIYPNPTSDVLNIPTKAGAKIAIYNSMGAKIYSGIAANDVTTIQTQAFPAGFYTVEAIAKDGVRQSAQFAKQ